MTFNFILKASKESHELLGQDAECTGIKQELEGCSDVPVRIRVAEQDGEPMGFAITSEPHEKMIGLQVLVVSKNAWRNGYGSILLEDIEAEAQRLGCSIQLIVLKDNTQARKFYKKHQYESFGEGPGGFLLRRSFNHSES